jgi:Flp pilus assembly protein TadG
MQSNEASLNAKGTRNARNSERGSAFVETALVAAFILIPLVVLAIDFGRGMYLAIEVANAARTAVQYGAQNGATVIDTTNMATVAKNEAPDVQTSCAGSSACWAAGYPLAQYGCECSSQTAFSGGTPNSTTCSCPGGHAVDYVKVTTRVTYTPLLRFSFGPITAFGPITLNSQAKMRYALQ